MVRGHVTGPEDPQLKMTSGEHAGTLYTQSTLFRTGEGSKDKEEHPTSVTPMPAQVGSLCWRSLCFVA